MLARITSDGRTQSLESHSNTVSQLCTRTAQTLGLASTARLMGLLHDMGKATADFQTYLNEAVYQPQKISIHPTHAAVGGAFVYRHWYQGGTAYQKVTAQLLILAICGHHAGLHDCIDQQKTSPLLNLLEREDPSRVEEATRWFTAHIAAMDKLDGLFHAACDEITCAMQTSSSVFFAGQLARLLLSILVDADRWDSACFQYQHDPLERTQSPDWKLLMERLERHLKEDFPTDAPLSGLRTHISDVCCQRAQDTQGIYTLSVPTGGGKTLSSLRYALHHAERWEHRRIFYIIPYNTILDQNAKDIRAALDDYPSILEHHSNVILEEQNASERMTPSSYQQLTERWDSDIILTSMVQFLNACYRAKNTDARRLHRLTNAVLIFDEVQALPKHCKVLFEKAVSFLSSFCHATVVLCTATQPKLKLQTEELMPQVTQLYQQLSRVRYLPQLSPVKTCAEAGEALAELICQRRAVLMIANTKAAARNCFENAVNQLILRGSVPVETPKGLTDAEILQQAQNAGAQEVLCIHLSTFMCAAHRLELLRWVRIWTRARKQVLCVSTALIEAGINVSFPVVVRSLAGLPSIIQAAGRCNRNLEETTGDVLLWHLDPNEEFLPKALEEIQKGQQVSLGLLANVAPDALGDPDTIRRYFEREEKQYNASMEVYEFPLKREQTTLVQMLDQNKSCKPDRTAPKPKQAAWNTWCLHQSFRTAGEHFAVIDQPTKSVLVPYCDGAELLTELQRDLPMDERVSLLRRAQRYSVNLFENIYRRLSEEGALRRLDSSDVVVLDGSYYSETGGVTTTRQEL